MSLSTTQYGYIIDPMVPFTDDKGKTIKNGFIRVFMAGTSTPVLTYRNYDGATNQEKIELDNSGRVKHNVIGSKGSLYKVVVYDAHHSQETPILTVDKIAVLGASINATGATIVTGLDSVTVQEENFIKATVEGTGVELALDPTEVTSELSTTAAAVTAATDYVVPLLDKTGEGDSKKISLANLFKFALDWISRLATTITSFASGDFIAVSNPTDGTRKMSKDTLLQLTAQNALAGNVAPAFVPNSTTTIADKPYVYNGLLYVAKEAYQGPWDASKFRQVSIESLREQILLDYSNITEPTKNLVSLLPKESSSNHGLTFSSDEKNHVRITGTTDTGLVDIDYELDGVVMLAAGSYAFSIQGIFDKSGSANVYLMDSTNSAICYSSLSSDGVSILSVPSSSEVAKIKIRFFTTEETADIEGFVQLESGTVVTDFMGPISALDYVARQSILDNIKNVDINISQFTEKTKNLVNIKPSPNTTNHGLTFSSDVKNRLVISGMVDGDQSDVSLNLQDDVTLAAGPYTFSIQGSFAKSGNANVYLVDGVGSVICYASINNVGVSVLSVPSSSIVHRILVRFFTDENTVNIAGNLQLEAGTAATGFANSISAVDYDARLAVDLLERTANNHVVPIFNNGSISSGVPDYSNYISCTQWLVTPKVYHVKKGSYIKHVGNKNVYLVIAKFVNGSFVSNIISSNFTGDYYFREDMDVRLAFRFTDYSVIVPSDASEIKFNLYSNDEQKSDLEIYFIGIGSGLNNSSGYAIIVKLPNGKNLVVDSHLLSYYNAFANALRNAGIRKIDYYVQTHYHGDHIGILNVLQYYSSRVDIEKSIAFLPPTITAESVAQVVATGDDPQTLVDRQDALIGYLEANDCTIIRPNNTTEYDLGGGVKLRFYNTDHSIYSDPNSGYYSTNYNDWSICPQLIFGMNVVNLSSDIGPIGERKVAGTLLKANILTAPHHGWDNGMNNLVPAFINNVSPDVVVSVNGSEHHPDNTESAASVIKKTSAMQSYCEANAVPNYMTCLNGPIKVIMNENAWKFDGTYSRYIRNDKNWSYTDNSEHIES